MYDSFFSSNFLHRWLQCFVSVLDFSRGFMKKCPTCHCDDFFSQWVAALHRVAPSGSLSKLFTINCVCVCVNSMDKFKKRIRSNFDRPNTCCCFTHTHIMQVEIGTMAWKKKGGLEQKQNNSFNRKIQFPWVFAVEEVFGSQHNNNHPRNNNGI